MTFVGHRVHVTSSSHLIVTQTQFNGPIANNINSNSNNEIGYCLQV